MLISKEEKTTQRCYICKENKPLDDFYRWKNGRDGRNYACIPCVKNRQHTNYNPQKQRELTVQYKYGLSSKEYYAMIEQSEGKCWSCGKLPTLRGLVVDHNHDTNKVRGLLCGNCNSALGYLQDDPILVERLLVYIKEFDQ